MSAAKRGLAVMSATVALLVASACGHGGGVKVDAGGASADAGLAAVADAAPLARFARPTRADSKALTSIEVCRMPVAARADARPGVAVYAREDGTCEGPFCDTVDTPPKKAGACFVANANLARAERDVRAGRGTAAEVRSTPWDRKSAPRFFDRVDAHLHLAPAELSLLRANGFVVLDRERYDSYAVAFHDVFQQQLPVYIGVDAIFNAVYQSSQTLLGEVEKTKLKPALVRLLDRMRATLAASKGRYDRETVTDLNVYLGVPHRLLNGDRSKPLADAGAETLVAQLVASAQSANEGLATVELFGRERVIDFSQFAPRGHYASDIDLREYFLAMMWLSRLELNVVSRSCRSSQPGTDVDPTETPREARVAIALADLVTRAGGLGELRSFEDVYSVFAGGREDLPLPALAALAQKSGFGPRDPEAPARLKAAIGEGWKRTARTHFMPDGADVLPVITTMFGPRIVPDIAPLTGLVHPAVPGRTTLSAADVGVVLGHERAQSYLVSDIANSPTLASALARGRTDLAESVRKHAMNPDVYSAWIGATLHLADAPRGTTPSFMRTAAFADLRLDSALAAYAQIRHTFVLVAGQGYDGYGCEIPDGYVEPALSVYEALLAWVRAASRAVPAQAAYFRRVTAVLETLQSIARTELSGAPLSEPQRRWLGMVSEYTPVGGSAGDSGEPPKYTGWYFDLFPDREIGAERTVALIADYFTLTNADQVRYIGIDKAALGVFVVDVGGEPRAMVGPVAKAYETSSPIATRLDDEAALTAPGRSSPWRASFAAAEREPPSVSARVFACADGARVVVEAATPLTTTVTLLDHHGDALGPSLSQAASHDPSVVVLALPEKVRESPNGIEGLHLGVTAPGGERWDFVEGVSTYHAGEYSSGTGDGESRFGIVLGSLRPTSSSTSR